jgi:hypothetical protein
MPLVVSLTTGKMIPNKGKIKSNPSLKRTKPTYIDLFGKSMPLIKITKYPTQIWYELESRIETIETTNQNLGQIIMKEGKQEEKT